MESTMEANGSYQEIYKEALDSGMTDVEARKKAAIAASHIYKRNWAMLGQDIVQYALLRNGFKGVLGSVDDFAQVAKATGKSVLPVYAKKTINGLSNMAGEGFEEGYQFIVGKEGDYLANLALDPSIESNKSDRLKEYIKDGEFYTSAFFGAIGAGVMQGTMKGLNQALQRGPNLASMQVENIKSWQADLSRSMKTQMVAGELDNENIARTNADVTMSNMVTKAASVGTLDKLKEFISNTEELSEQEMAAYGISKEQAEEISKNKESLLGDVNRFEKIHKDTLKKLDKNEIKSMNHALYISRDELLLEKYKDRVAKYYMQYLTESDLPLETKMDNLFKNDKKGISKFKEFNEFVDKFELDSIDDLDIDNES
jgi:hypothetical protein